MPDAVVIGRLSHYGKVLSFRREREANFYNGIRSARMHLYQDIPSTIFIAGEKVRAWHSGQPRACRRCGLQDHIAKDCSAPRCWNCEKAGHRSTECPEKPLCSICLADDHPLASCPFFACSANVADVRAGESSYARVTAAAVCEGGAAAREPTNNRRQSRIAENKERREKEGGGG